MVFNLQHPRFGAYSYDFSGASEVARSGDNVEVALLESGTLTLRMGILADVFACNAGDRGATPDEDGDMSGGDGGDGGRWTRWTGIFLPAGIYSVKVGVDGDVQTSLGSICVVPDDAQRKNGGHGADAGYAGDRSAASGEDGVPPWESGDSLLFPGRLFAPGGAGGGAWDSRWVNRNPDGADGGDDGGGAGGDAEDDGGNAGSDGAPNSGGGGGGGGGRCYTINQTYSNGRGGLGGSGIIMFRKHKEVAS